MATVVAVVVVRGMVVAAAAPRIRRNKGALGRWKRTEVGPDFILDNQVGEQRPSSKIKTETRLFVFFLAFLSQVNNVQTLIYNHFFCFPTCFTFIIMAFPKKFFAIGCRAFLFLTHFVSIKYVNIPFLTFLHQPKCFASPPPSPDAMAKAAASVALKVLLASGLSSSVGVSI